jgi:hypothetical protein
MGFFVAGWISGKVEGTTRRVRRFDTEEQTSKRAPTSGMQKQRESG